MRNSRLATRQSVRLLRTCRRTATWSSWVTFGPFRLTLKGEQRPDVLVRGTLVGIVAFVVAARTKLWTNSPQGSGSNAKTSYEQVDRNHKRRDAVARPNAGRDVSHEAVRFRSVFCSSDAIPFANAPFSAAFLQGRLANALLAHPISKYLC